MLSLQAQVFLLKSFLVFAIGLLSLSCQGQSSVLLLKKKGKTIQKIFTGRNFEFITTDGMPVSGRLDQVIRDSVFLTYFQVAQAPTAFGTLRTDTMGHFPLAFGIKNIGQLPRIGGRAGKGLLSGALILGGASFTFVNLVNTLREGYPPFGPENRGRLLAGIGAATAGWLLGRTGSSAYTLGKKYQLQVLE